MGLGGFSWFFEGFEVRLDISMCCDYSGVNGKGERR